MRRALPATGAIIQADLAQFRGDKFSDPGAVPGRHGRRPRLTIDKHSHGVDGVTYVAFLVPGLLAGTCMQIGTNDTTYPVMGAIKWVRTYFAQLAGTAQRR